MERLIAVLLLTAFLGGVTWGAKTKEEVLPPNLKKQRESYEKVTYYTLEVVKDGIKAEFPIVRVGDTYYGLPMKLRNGEFVKVEPKVTLVPVKGGFLKRALEEFKRVGVNPEVKGKEEKPTLYVIFDALCPFCIKSAKEKLPELLSKYNLVFLPLAVHGESSYLGLSCIYTKAKKEGIKKAIEEVFSWKDGKSWKEYEEKLQTSCPLSKDVAVAVRRVSELLKKNGVYATPTFFLEKDGKFYKRVGVPDFSLVEE